MNFVNVMLVVCERDNSECILPLIEPVHVSCSAFRPLMSIHVQAVVTGSAVMTL